MTCGPRSRRICATAVPAGPWLPPDLPATSSSTSCPGTSTRLSRTSAGSLATGRRCGRLRSSSQTGYFGAAGPRLRERVGDVVVLPRPGGTVWWREPGRFDMLFRGHHGGLSPEEMLIPLAAAADRLRGRNPSAGAETSASMEPPLDLTRPTEMPVLARIVVPLTAVHKEAIGEVRGMSRESCQVPLPHEARVVQAERTEGAWVVWYVEKVEAIAS